MEHVTTTFRLPEELYEKLRYDAFSRKVSLGEIVRRACAEYMKNHEQELHLKCKE